MKSACPVRKLNCIAVILAALVVALAATAGEVAREDAGEPNSPPSSVDLRPRFEKLGLSTRLQGSRGTCSVFAVAGALEYARAIRLGKSEPVSVEFLNWASNRSVGVMKDGSFFSDLWKGFTANGACDEKEMPYRDTFDPNREPGEQAKEHAREFLELGCRMHWIKRWNVNTGLSGRQLARIKRTLARKWPVCGGFRWPKEVRWKKGVLQMAPPEGVRDGHSVLLVGYRDDPNQPGGGVLIFRNSNGDGRDGFMSYEYASAYMNDAIWISCRPQEPNEPRDSVR